MSGERKIIASAAGSSVKRPRKSIDFERKMKIIEEYEKGKKVILISRDYGLACSTISTILKDKDRIKETAKTVGCKATIARHKKSLIQAMEKLLIIWYDDKIQKQRPLNLLTIQSKALSIFKNLKAHKGEGCTETFTASSGWYRRFSRRYDLKNRGVSGKAASADINGVVEKVLELEDAQKSEEEEQQLEVEELHIKEEKEEENGDERTEEQQQLEEEEQQLEEEELQIREEKEKENGDERTEEQQHLEEEVEEETAGVVKKKFSAKGLARVFSKANQALLELEAIDSNAERFLKFERYFNESLQIYRDIYIEEKKRTSRYQVWDF